MTPHPSLVAFARALGAVQAGVAAHGLLPAAWMVPPLLTALPAGVVLFLMGKRLSREVATGVVVRGYLAPVLLVASLRVLMCGPTTWDAAGAGLKAVLAATFAGTPPFVYLACPAYACLSVKRPAEPGMYR